MYQGLETPELADPSPQIELQEFLLERKLTEQVTFNLPKGVSPVEIRGSYRVPGLGFIQRTSVLKGDGSSSSTTMISYLFERPEAIIHWTDSGESGSRSIEELPHELREIAMNALQGELLPPIPPHSGDAVVVPDFRFGEKIVDGTLSMRDTRSDGRVLWAFITGIYSGFCLRPVPDMGREYLMMVGEEEKDVSILRGLLEKNLLTFTDFDYRGFQIFETQGALRAHTGVGYRDLEEEDEELDESYIFSEDYWDPED